MGNHKVYSEGMSDSFRNSYDFNIFDRNIDNIHANRFFRCWTKEDRSLAHLSIYMKALVGNARAKDLAPAAWREALNAPFLWLTL